VSRRGIRLAYQDLAGSYHEYMRARGGTHVHTITKVVTLPLTNGCNSDHQTDETEIRSGSAVRQSNEYRMTKPRPYLSFVSQC
jgi:hypothetical protein